MRYYSIYRPVSIGTYPNADDDTLDELMGAAYNPGEQMGLELWANYRDAIAS